jgi:phosphoenolpyruvate carboxykinase (ATP)
MTIASGQETSTGALAITRENIQDDPFDRFIVKDSEDEVWWGKVNILFDLQLLKHCTKVTSYLSNKEVFVRDSYVCADPNYRLNVRVLRKHLGQIYFVTICFETRTTRTGKIHRMDLLCVQVS